MSLDSEPGDRPIDPRLSKVSNLMLSSRLRPGPPNGILTPGLPTKTL